MRVRATLAFKTPKKLSVCINGWEKRRRERAPNEICPSLSKCTTPLNQTRVTLFRVIFHRHWLRGSYCLWIFLLIVFFYSRVIPSILLVIMSSYQHFTFTRLHIALHKCMFNCFAYLCHTTANIELVHWPLIGGLLHLVHQTRDWAGYTKCTSPPINCCCCCCCCCCYSHCIVIYVYCYFNILNINVVILI